MAETAALIALAQAQFALNLPSFYGYQANAQSIPNTAWTSLTIDNGVDDNYSGHSNSTNPNRYTCQVAGTYLVSGCYASSANASGFRAVRLQKNGSPILGGAAYLPANGGAENGVNTPVVEVALAIGDWVEPQAYQSSGGALNTALDVDQRTSFTVRFSHF
jgi:hypothetical protein